MLTGPSDEAATALPTVAAPAPAVTEPAVTEPAVTEPAVTEPAVTEPGRVEPVGAEPGRVEPGGAGPARTGRAGRAGLPFAVALVVAAVGGLALAGAFPPAGFWPLAVVGPALLTVALWQRSLRGSLVAGFVFGLAFFIPLLSWLINLAWYAWIALALAEAVIFAVASVGQRLLLNLRAWPAAVPLWWVAAEALRDRWPFGGFPWGRLAMSQSASPAGPWVAVGGAPLLTFLLASCGAALAWLVLAPGTRGRLVRSRLGPAGVLAAALAVTLSGTVLPVDQPGAGASTATVAAVQGDVPHSRTLTGLLRATTVTANHAAATAALARQVRDGSRPAPDVVIWPENSTDLDPGLSPETYATISSAVTAINRPILVGAVLQNPVRNAGQLWLPGRGPVRTYIKRRLVPFGEVIPFRSVLSKFIPLIKLQPADFHPGHSVVVFGVGKIRLGDVICYEVGFDDLVRSEVSAHANLLTVQTNDATFEVDGQTGETLQQLAMARIRAMEFDRSVVVASTTGVSAIVAPDGSLTARTGTWQRAVLDVPVSLRTTRTLADRAGGWPEYLLTLAALAALAWATVAAASAARARRRATLG
jgi:apolipoprotein N-acyltransferase